MVQNEVSGIPAGYGIVIISRFIPQSHPEVPDDYMVGIYAQRMPSDADAITRGCLPGNGDKGMFDAQGAFKYYGP
jgi:hypothetical protein